MANLTNSPQCHSELSTTRLKVDEQAVQDLDTCITEFACDPFDLANLRLRSLQSGMLASEKLIRDFETAHDDGERLIQQFFTDRMFSHTTPFDAVVHRNSEVQFQ